MNVVVEIVGMESGGVGTKGVEVEVVEVEVEAEVEVGLLEGISIVSMHCWMVNVELPTPGSPSISSSTTTPASHLGVHSMKKSSVER